MNKLFIYCDGGFGNRFGTLLGGHWGGGPKPWEW